MDKTSGVMLGAVVCLAPLPYGSDQYGWVCIWMGMLCAAVLLQLCIAQLPSRKAPLVTVSAIGFALVALAAFQLSDLVPSQFVHPAWSIASEHGIAAPGRIAVEAGAPLRALASPLAVLLAFVAGYLRADRRSQCWSLIKIFIISGVIYALLGIFVGVANPGYVLFERKIAYQEDFTGTFINRNTAASYFGVCLLAAGTIAFRAWRDNWPTGYLPAKERFLFLVRMLTSATILWILAVAVLLVAILLTGSRAGTATSAFSAFILLILLIRKIDQALRTAVLLAAIVAAVAIVQIFGAGNILKRVSEGFHENGRYDTWASSWNIVRDYPWFGTGLGTFKMAFPPYRQSDVGIMQIWEKAHSTPLEWAVELGLPAASVMTIVWIFAQFILLRKYLMEPHAYALPALGLGAMILIEVHSAVDFPMQIAGCAIPITVLLGAIFRQVLDENSITMQRVPG